MNRMLKLAVLADQEREMLRHGWGGFVALGVLFLLLGLVGLVFVGIATLVTIVLIGWVFLIAGIAEVVHAVIRKGWSGFWLDLISGVVTALAGLVMLMRPEQGASFLTVVVGLMFLIGGIFRLAAGVAVKNPYPGWFLFHGALSLLLGVLILSDWPVSSAWVIGTLVSIDLVLNGIRLISFGTALKGLPEVGGDAERTPLAPVPNRPV
jgi:uncharacterized membrane protein HdeD (DUF308 family)